MKRGIVLLLFALLMPMAYAMQLGSYGDASYSLNRGITWQYNLYNLDGCQHSLVMKARYNNMTVEWPIEPEFMPDVPYMQSIFHNNQEMSMLMFMGFKGYSYVPLWKGQYSNLTLQLLQGDTVLASTKPVNVYVR